MANGIVCDLATLFDAIFALNFATLVAQGSLVSCATLLSDRSWLLDEGIQRSSRATGVCKRKVFSSAVVCDRTVVFRKSSFAGNMC